VTTFSAQNYGLPVQGIIGAIALGTTQDTATVIVTQATVFTEVASGGAALLPSSNSSMIWLIVFNRGDNTLFVYPPRGCIIDALGVNTPIGIPAGGVAFFWNFDPAITPGVNWFSSAGLAGGGAVDVVGPFVYASSFQVKADGKVHSTALHNVGLPVGPGDGTIAANSNAFSSASSDLTAEDEGKAIQVSGAGAAGAPLYTTIATVTGPTTATLTAKAVTGVTGADFCYGTDDTTAWENAFAAASAAGGATVLAPVGVSIVSALTTPVGINLFGSPCNTYDGDLYGGSILRRLDPTLTTPVVKLGFGSTTYGMSVWGANNADGLNSAFSLLDGGFAVLDRCNMYLCSIGIDCQYRQVVATRCNIHECGGGITQPVDSRILNNYINGNSGAGIYCGTGANDNTISNNKIEWNGGQNILLYGCVNLDVTGNTLDRSGLAGIEMVGVGNSDISHNVIRRSGRFAEGNAAEDCHMKIQGCTNCTITGIETYTGANDDGSGYNSPAAALSLQQNTNVFISGQWVYTTTPFGLYYLPGVVFLPGNLGLGDTVSAGVGTVSIAQGAQILTTTGGGAPSVAITYALAAAGGWATYSTGRWLEVTFYGRDSVTPNSVACTLNCYFRMEAGTPVLQWDITNELLAYFGGPGDGTILTITPTISSDGSTLTITVANTSATIIVNLEWMIQRFGNWNE